MDTLLADYSVDFMTIIDGAQWRRVRNSSWGSASYKLQGFEQIQTMINPTTFREKSLKLIFVIFPSFFFKF